MLLTFDRTLVERLMAHSAAAPKRKATWGQKGDVEPGLWLVGDDGVYLMSNGDPGLLEDGGQETRQQVAYADQVNPKTMPFEAWYEAKRRSFGGDDGCEFIGRHMVSLMLGRAARNKSDKVEMEVSPTLIGALN